MSFVVKKINQLENTYINIDVDVGDSLIDEFDQLCTLFKMMDFTLSFHDILTHNRDKRLVGFTANKNHVCVTVDLECKVPNNNVFKLSCLVECYPKDLVKEMIEKLFCLFDQTTMFDFYNIKESDFQLSNDINLSLGNFGFFIVTNENNQNKNNMVYLLKKIKFIF